MIAVIIAYFVFIWLLSLWIDVHGNNSESNSSFYMASRRSNWLMVAYGMVGASVSGVSFVSVPGMVATSDMSYLQMCLGFVPGYMLVAFVLLPIYYRLNLTSIYSLLQQRLGNGAYRTGAWFFIVSDMLGMAVKFFLVCVILQRFVFDDYGLPFVATVPILVLCIWLYTRRGGISTLVRTDVIQTTCMIVAIILIIYGICDALGLSLIQVLEVIRSDRHSRLFVFDDFASANSFWKQFVSGMFVVVVMTGLNQNMMQKNLTCRTLREAQKNMCLSGLLFLPVNMLLLAMGLLLLIILPESGGDGLLPDFVQESGTTLRVVFVLGIAAAAFSSADSSLTALTTSYCVDVAGKPNDVRLRRYVHIAMGMTLVVLVYVLRYVGSDSLIGLVYTLVSYTYGPLLGLFVLALIKKEQPTTIPMRLCLFICLCSPAICYAASCFAKSQWMYSFGYELLLVNAFLTFVPLHIYASLRKSQ